MGVSGLGRWGKRERKGGFSGLLLLINTASFSQIDQKTKKWALLQWQGAFEPTRGGFLQRAAWARNHIFWPRDPNSGLMYKNFTLQLPFYGASTGEQVRVLWNCGIAALHCLEKIAHL